MYPILTFGGPQKPPPGSGLARASDRHNAAPMSFCYLAAMPKDPDPFRVKDLGWRDEGCLLAVGSAATASRLDSNPLVVASDSKVLGTGLAATLSAEVSVVRPTPCRWTHPLPELSVPPLYRIRREER
jgi:hypothetical protein